MTHASQAQGRLTGGRVGLLSNSLLGFESGSLAVASPANSIRPLSQSVKGCQQAGGERTSGQDVRQNALANLVNALRHRGESGDRHGVVPAGGLSNVRRPVYSSPHAGIIAPSLVGRPVMQFRGTKSPNVSASVNANVRRSVGQNRLQASEIVDLVEDEDVPSESYPRIHQNKDTNSKRTYRQADANVLNPRQSSGITSWHPQVPEVRFTSNGMMQMEMYHGQGCNKIPVGSLYGSHGDGISPLDLDSLSIAQHIGAMGALFMLQRNVQQPPRRHVGVFPCDVLNLISDEEDVEPRIQTHIPSRTQSGAATIGCQSCEGRRAAPNQGHIMECLQPLLNAIDIVSAENDEKISTNDALAGLAAEGFPDEVMERRKNDRGKKRSTLKGGLGRPRTNREANIWNSITHEIHHVTPRRKRYDKEKRRVASRCSEDGEHVRSGSLQQVIATSFKAKRMRARDLSDVEDNPYRKTYRRRYDRSKYMTKHSHRFMNGTSIDDEKHIELWRFLNHRIQASQPMTEDQYPQPAVEDIGDAIPGLSSILSSSTPLCIVSETLPSGEMERSQIKAFLEQLSDVQQQTLVQHNGLCGFFNAVLTRHASSAS